jgi:hypothetical protein
MGHDSYIIIMVHRNVNIHVSSHVSNVCDVYFYHRYWITFIFVIDTGSGLGSVDSKLFYDGVETSRIISIYNIFVKSL